MSEEPAVTDGGIKRYRPRKMAIIGMGLLLFVMVGAIAMVLCDLRVKYSTQTILAQKRDVQQAWLDKSMEAIRVWRNELVDQGRYISSSDMIRLFVIDVRNLTPKEIEYLADPDALSSPDEATRSMAEQMTYVQDLLRDFTQRRAWNDARILLPDGSPMVEPPFSPPLSGAQSDLARKAANSGQPTFGPLRQGENGLYMDMADPLYEVQGKEDHQVVAVLLLSLPMDRPLTTFLARNGEQTDTLLPRIVSMDRESLYMALPYGGRTMIEPLQGDVQKLEPLPFALRPALDGKSQVYSMGGLLSGLKWLFVLETPASEIEEIIHTQKLQIYGLGILGSLGVALLAAWLWAGHTSRKHEAEAIRYEGLYKTISNQKMILDSINASFKEGIILVDEYGRMQMCNPSFRALFHPAEIEPNTPLVECMPSFAAVALLQDISKVKDADKSVCVELSIPTLGQPKDRDDGKRLYRITLYPYSETVEDGPKVGGCVAIFADITEFRAKALAERERARAEKQRQEALISAFVHAVESIDPNLVGHSDKMATVSRLLADQLRMDEKQKETVSLSAKLSQVGKLFVPRELLTKEGKLTPEELAELKRAPQYTEEILHDLHFDLPVKETVGLINERVDGSGKPAGLKGDEISPEGKVLEVVNAFIAMTSARAWRKGGSMSIQDAIADLRKNPGFDQKTVEALAAIPPEAIAEAIGKKTASKHNFNDSLKDNENKD